MSRCGVTGCPVLFMCACRRRTKSTRRTGTCDIRSFPGSSRPLTGLAGGSIDIRCPFELWPELGDSTALMLHSRFQREKPPSAPPCHERPRAIKSTTDCLHLFVQVRCSSSTTVIPPSGGAASWVACPKGRVGYPHARHPSHFQKPPLFTRRARAAHTHPPLP